MRSCLANWTEGTACPALGTEEMAPGTAVDRQRADLVPADRTLQQAGQLLQYCWPPAGPHRGREGGQWYQVGQGGKVGQVRSVFWFLFHVEELRLGVVGDRTDLDVLIVLVLGLHGCYSYCLLQQVIFSYDWDSISRQTSLSVGQDQSVLGNRIPNFPSSVVWPFWGFIRHHWRAGSISPWEL